MNQSKIKFFLLASACFVFFGAIYVKAENVLTFNQNLYFGVQNNTDVVRLQMFLKQKGYYNGPETGNFFSLTFDGVKKFQQDNNIDPVSGYFGPMSRLVVNRQILTDAIEKLSSALNAYKLLQSTSREDVPFQSPPIGTTQSPISTPLPVLPSVSTTTNSDILSDVEMKEFQDVVLELKRGDYLNQPLEESGPFGCTTISKCQTICAKQANYSQCESFFSSRLSI